MTSPGRVTRVLIVDDSALMRQLLSELLAGEPDLEVVGAAANPLVARELIKQLNPDVLTLDVEMPKMDGLEFLERLMTLRPMPVVMVSSLTDAGAATTLRALELGAVDFIAKPKIDLQRGLGQLRGEIVAKLRAAAQARVKALDKGKPARGPLAPTGYMATELIIAIGASTGGVEALREVLCAMPADFPGVLIAQHMPAKFTTSFAARLDSIAAVRVQEASNGVRILPGHVFIAPGDFHLRLARSGANYVCDVQADDAVSGHRPSVDALFNSVAATAGAGAIGVILTGMGRDGATGLLRMREAGAATFGEAESSCVVYGMPKAAQAIGAVGQELPLGRIVPEILKICRAQGRAVRI